MSQAHSSSRVLLAKPQYARFWKADLQMQTPADRRHWRGESTRLSQTPTDEEIAASARAYVERCYEVGLEIWGLTDHNLGGDTAKSFFYALRDAVDEIAPAHGWRPAIFPGFEIEANVGKGLHLLCLFDPNTSFEDVDDVLTNLGLPRKARFASGKPKPLLSTLDDILDCVQDEHRGLVIAAHPDSSKGAMSDGDLARWLSVSVITNERLLCMELRHGRDTYLQAPGTLGAVVRNDPGEWHRRHPIAVVTSSDCKRLREDDGSGDESWIGKRFCWLKMSDRSIEGLRQAFLDHESRIRHGKVRPESLERHPRVLGIGVEGVDFLTDQELALSPNLTTLIGGGGTGKSTLIEYLRAAFQQGVSVEAQDVAENHKKILRSLGDGQVHVVLEQGGERLSVTLHADRIEARDSQGNLVEDLATRFPVMVLGQREVYAVAESQPATLAFLDRLQADRIRELDYRAEQIGSAIAELNDAMDRMAQLESRLGELREEKARLEAELRALQAQQQPLELLDSFRREEKAIARFEGAIRERVAAVRQTAASMEEELPALTLQPPTPSIPDLQGLASRGEKAAKEVAALLMKAAEHMETFVSTEREADWRAAWRRAFDDARAAYEAVAQADDEEGASAEELRSSIEAKESEISRLKKQVAELKKRASERPSLLAELKDVWQEQVAAREKVAELLGSMVPSTPSGEPYVEVSVEPYGDGTPLAEALHKRISDNRAFNRQDADDVISAVYSVRDSNEEPTAILCSWLRAIQAGDQIDELSLSAARYDALRSSFTESEIRKLELLRASDLVRVILRRQDGSVAGALDQGLSVGQRCTAILALVLSAGEFPILIDQPEDEIDNEFIYRELVPLLRRAKHKRQVIISTHDPNLPVNGDAELIYALEARSGNGGSARGGPKMIQGGPAVGSLDRWRVKLAVEEIMEGSEEAFRRRHARYGF